MNYKDEITTRIKDTVNDWIERLIEQKPDLHLTRQWKLVHDNGFLPGHSVLPVVTNSKIGPHLIGEVGFQVSSDLEIDLDDIEFTQKDESYKVDKKVNDIRHISEPLDLLNEILVGINGFIASLSFPEPHRTVQMALPFGGVKASSVINPARVKSQQASLQDIDEVRLQIKHRTVLPEWLRTISNSDVHDRLIDKIAESYLQYTDKAGNQVSIQEFLKMYEDYLKREGKLYDYCSYKAKGVELDEKDICQESYCSKKPFNKTCEHAGLKFGSK